MTNDINGYELSRNWFNWSFDNPELVKPIHSAVYFFAIEHCNRLGWKDKFGFPSQMVMESIGVKNWRTYSKALNDLVDFGFIKMVEISKNQYSSNIIAIVKNTKAPTKALDKALSKHSTKHSTKHSQSTVSIDKQITINNKQENKGKSSLTSLEEKKSKFLKWFNQMLKIHKGKEGRFRSLSKDAENNYKKLIEAKHTIEEFEHVFKVMLKEPWVIQHESANPSHFLRNDNFNRYLSKEYTNKPKINMV